MSRPIFPPASSAIENGTRHVRNHIQEIKILACGFMISSSIVLPILCSTPISSRTFSQVDLGISVASTISFGILHQENIVENGPVVVGLLSAAGFLALLLDRISLAGFAPFLPLSVTVGLLIAVSVVPWIRESTQSENRLTVENLLLATGGSRRSTRSNDGTVDPDSTQSMGIFHSDVNWPFRQDSDPLAFAHIGHIEAFQMVPIPDDGDNASNIDLESGLHQEFGTVSESGNSHDPLL